MLTPTHADSTVIISELQQSSCTGLSLKPGDACAQRREIEGRGLHQKAPWVLIDMHRLSSYRRLLPLPLLLLHWKGEKRQAGTELQHRGVDEKPTASPLSPQKTEQSCTESQLNRPADVDAFLLSGAKIIETYATASEHHRVAARLNGPSCCISGSAAAPNAP
ncbi:hypothetical protein EYF80_000197 [Liparis tanakae]|uniref:Uncharacterized protein n=1 Tax=Liparis tanakae TaxID=230148 RepID=A0A4Z2JIL2_9TELE|nr:hypothetical protein EYF80_000197 [Liparis tanakae]